jgi:hypothetical protein
MLARSLWPDTRINVIADGGIGLGKPDNPSFITSVRAEWGITDLIPESCEDCFGDSHATTIASWALERDEDLGYLHVTSEEDFVISSLFLDIGGDNQTLDDILGRFNVTAINSVTGANWLGKWLDDSPDFSSLVD